MLRELRNRTGSEDLNDIAIVLGNLQEKNLERLSEATEGLRSVVELSDAVRSGKVRMEEIDVEDIVRIVNLLSAAGLVLRQVLGAGELAADFFGKMRDRRKQGKTGLDDADREVLRGLYAQAAAEREEVVKDFLGVLDESAEEIAARRESGGSAGGGAAGAAGGGDVGGGDEV